MSINITIFLGLLLLFVLQQTQESYDFNKSDSKELNEKIKAKANVIASENNHHAQPAEEEEKHPADTYVDLTKTQERPARLNYRIAPQIPDFSSAELNWQKQVLVLDLFVNEHGDVEQVLFENKNQKHETNKIFQKLKPAFLKAKFYPYVENGKSKAFRAQQPIEIESSEKEPILHRIFGNILGENQR
ncbi:hypothetical protein [Acinetobacter courvalinii]|uniref:hypothetical protein n=1 Tax=Acinetobacter courvalinii TaxID=280147 RepID=UPI0021D271AF|nr:hypothetical protein [Acinetobacter courvalinii]MCU4640194.1 hypothetical protein [Acinetobacter courvalinii]